MLSFYTRVATTWTCTCTITTTLIGRRHRLGVVNYPQGLFIFSQKNLIAMRMHCSMQPNIESLWIILGQEGQIIIPAFIDMLSTFSKIIFAYDKEQNILLLSNERMVNNDLNMLNPMNE